MTAIEEAIDWFQSRLTRKNGGRVAMAKYLDVAPGAITYWELRGVVPDKFVNKLAKKTGIPPSRFRKGDTV